MTEKEFLCSRGLTIGGKEQKQLGSLDRMIKSTQEMMERRVRCAGGCGKPRRQQGGGCGEREVSETRRI